MCSDAMVLIAIEADDIAASIRFWYRACFGLASVASVIAIYMSLKMLVRKVRERNRTLKKTLSKRTAHEDEADAIKLEIQTIYCAVLIGACEDIPLGTLNLLYLRLYIINATPARVQSLTGALLTMVSFASTFTLLGYKIASIAALPQLWKRQKLLLKSRMAADCFLEQLPQRRLAKAFNAWREAVAASNVVCEASDEESQRIADPECLAAIVRQPDVASGPPTVSLSAAHPSTAIAPPGDGCGTAPAAMLTTSLSDQMVDELECLVCHELLSLPVTTACGHSFCRKCLAACVERCGKSCPVCRTELAPALPMLNVLLERLVEMHRYPSKNIEHVPTPCVDSVVSPPEEVAPPSRLSLQSDESASRTISLRPSSSEGVYLPADVRCRLDAKHHASGTSDCDATGQQRMRPVTLEIASSSPTVCDSVISSPEEVAATGLLLLHWDESAREAVTSLQVKSDMYLAQLSQYNEYRGDAQHVEPDDLAWI
jgi:hypothetical protein